MRRLTHILSALALLAIGISSMAGAGAEAAGGATGRYGINLLMEAGDIPATTTIRYDPDIPEGAVAEQKSHAVELVSSRGDVLNVEVTFDLVNLPLNDDQWQQVTDWLKGVVTSAVQSVGADSESLANVVAEAIARQRSAQGGQIWANPGLKVRSVSASVPWYPELTVGDSGGATQRLQKRLIELGFLDDTADGHFGENTKQAVQALERYVRLLEQDAIDVLPESTPAPAATLDPNAYAIPLALVMPVLTPEPLLANMPEPETPVDGVADAMLQAYLFSDGFRVARGDLTQGAEGDQVSRLQRRLRGLGYLADAADGVYGGSTARSVRIFQHYNGLPLTGAADGATQARLFSDAAEKPDNAMLQTGSSGEAVSKLQKRLRVLGFAPISVDGSFGLSTKTGVENLQRYMRELESEAVTASSGAAPSEDQLTTQVNGIADPLLQDDFYSDSFPAIPAQLGTGSTGRDVTRLQRRLSMLEYYYDEVDGNYGAGTSKAVMDFQKRHGLSQTGVADPSTMATLFDENAKKALKPYRLKVSVADQRVYAYGLDANNEYTDLVRTMKCSTGRKGTPTPTGTFRESTGPGARWHYFKKFDCWAQYAFYIEGDIMFHSVLYGSMGGSVTRSSVNNLGSRASHGCVRLSVEDAKWIWTNCPRNTTVEVS